MSSLAVRAATLDDAEAIAGITVRAWQVAYAGILPPDELRSLDAAGRARTWRSNLQNSPRTVFVSLSEGRVGGFCCSMPSRDSDAAPRTGEITALYVDPPEWRRGHGRGLVVAFLARARTLEWDSVSLWVLGANAGARAFYVAMGFLPDGTERSHGDSPVTELRYRLRLSA